MRLRTNIVVQILMTLMQAYNQISDLLPAKWKDSATLVMGIVQAVVALIAHYSNPDGTPAALKYVAPVKSTKLPMVIIGFLVLSSITLPIINAQEAPVQFFAAGLAYNGYATPNVAFTALYAKKLNIGENVYSFNYIDVLSKTDKFYTVTPSVTTGLAKEFFKIQNMPIYGSTGIGASAGGNDFGWAWTAGAASSIAIGKQGWHLLPNVRMVKSSLSDYQLIYGVMIGWGK